MATRRVLVLLIGLLFSPLPALAADEPSSALLGRWRSLKTSARGIGFMLEFRKDGVVDWSPGVVVEWSYRIEGNQLVLSPPTTDGPEKTPAPGRRFRETIKWLGDDRLRLSFADGSGIELARKSSRNDAESPMLGEWAGMQDMGGQKLEALFFFYPKDQALRLIPFRMQQGSYSLKDGKIHLALPGLSPADRDGEFKVEGDVLTLSIPESHGIGGPRYSRY